MRGAGLDILDDGDRETAYTAGAEKAVTMGRERDWTVISVKNDWRTAFSFDERPTSS